MRPSRSAFALALLALPAVAQGPIDIVPLRVGSTGSGGFALLGSSAARFAWSASSTACNQGTLPVPYAAEEVHIATNLFRYHLGRVEQIGYSWLHRDQCALNELGCGSCQSTTCSTLGVGCATTTSASVMDGTFGHDKADIDPTTAFFVQPASVPSGDPALAGRLQAPAAVMDLPGARYFVEQQYLVHSDHTGGNARDSVAWREVVTSSVTGELSGLGFDTQPGQCAIDAWQAFDPSVVVVEVVNDREPSATGGERGHFVLGARVTDIGGGEWLYEYALQNLTSRQAAASFALVVDCGTPISLSNFGYHDVERHSGTPWSNVEWARATQDGVLSWSCTETFGQNPDANALRWGELFNFSFTADAPPSPTSVSIGLFEPGALGALSAVVPGPCATPPCGATSYCTANPNSVGSGARIGASGATSVSANELVLEVEGGVPGQVGLFLYGPLQQSVPFGDGVLCVTGGFFRLNPPVAADAGGNYSRPLDLDAPPANGGAGEVTPGSRWNFQLWYRDPAAGGAGWNLSDGLEVVFCP